MKLSAQQLADLRKHGFLALPGLFTLDEIVPMQSESDRIAFSARRYPEANVYDQNGAVRVAFGLKMESEIFDRMARDPRILGPVRQILGEDIYLYQDRVSPKKGRAGDAFGWHQDFAVWVHADGIARDSYDRMVSVMVMLDDSRPEKGCLRVIADSHADGLLGSHYESSVTGRRAYHIDVPVDESRAIDIVGPPGTVMLFSPALIHGSNQNLTDEPRRMVFLVYNRLDNLPATPGGGDQLFSSYDPVRIEPMAAP